MSIKLSFTPLFAHALLAAVVAATAQEPATSMDWLEFSFSPRAPLCGESSANR